MRVKLQYSVELEEVPKEARPLLSRANGEIHDAANHMDDIFAFFDTGTDYANIIDSIDQARKNLAEADFRLGDVEAILGGYLQAKHAPSQEQQSPMEFTQLQDKLASLKDTLHHVEGEQDEQV